MKKLEIIERSNIKNEDELNEIKQNIKDIEDKIDSIKYDVKDNIHKLEELEDLKQILNEIE